MILQPNLSEWLVPSSTDFSFSYIKSSSVESYPLRLFDAFLWSLKQFWKHTKVFLAKGTGVFFVKEPERSLKVKWMHTSAAQLDTTAFCAPHRASPLQLLLLLTLIRCYQIFWYLPKTIPHSFNVFHMQQRLHAFNNSNCFLLSERQELNATFCWTFSWPINGSFFLLYPARLPLLFPATQIEFYQPERIFLLNEAQHCNNLKGIFRQRSKNVWFVIACWTLAQSVAIWYPPFGWQTICPCSGLLGLPTPSLFWRVWIGNPKEEFLLLSVCWRWHHRWAERLRLVCVCLKKLSKCDVYGIWVSCSWLVHFCMWE